jgi:hypothetical protein
MISQVGFGNMPVASGQGRQEIMMKMLLLIAGVVAIAMGLLWAAQGAGLFPYPSTSFMINNTAWIYYGLATAAGGIVLLALARR